MEFEDHGDPSVDERWRKMLGDPVQRHASLGGAIPPEDAHYVPPELKDEGRIPQSYFVCIDIPNGPEDV